MTTKLKGRFVIGYDGTDHVILEDGEVVYENDTIIFVGFDYDKEVDETIDAGNSVISPGFIDLDALGDVDHELFFYGVDKEDISCISWSEEYFNGGSVEAMSKEEEAFKSYYAFSHLIMNGITTAMPITCVYYKKAGETYEEMVNAALNAGKLGLRAYLGPSYISGMKVIKEDGSSEIKFTPEEGERGLEKAVKFVKEFDNKYDGLIKGVLVPERIEFQTEEVLKKTKAYGKELGCLVRLHAAQGKYEYDEIMKKHGVSTIKYLDNIGFLDDHTLIPHAIFASGYSKIDDKTDEDLDILNKQGTSIIHCPLVYSRGGIALESFGRYKEKGINISMGTDTFPPDFFMNIRVGSAFAKNKAVKEEKNGYEDFFRAATLGGAEALNRKDLGKLEKGAKADIIIIDLDRYGIGVVDDPIYTICLSAFGSDVKTSIINGRIVMKDRIIPGFNEEEIKIKASLYYKKMKESYLSRSYKKFKNSEDLFKSSFKTIRR